MSNTEGVTSRKRRMWCSTDVHVGSPAFLEANLTHGEIKCIYILWPQTLHSKNVPQGHCPGYRGMGTRACGVSSASGLHREFRKLCVDHVQGAQATYPRYFSLYRSHDRQTSETCAQGKKKEMKWDLWNNIILANFLNVQTQNIYFPHCAHIFKKSTQWKRVNWKALHLHSQG